MKIKKLILIAIGCITLGLGCLGIVLPILPTVPFFIITFICFTRSDEKLYNWFINTKLYKNNLESFIKKKGMTIKAKLTLTLTITLLMAIGFFTMKSLILRIILLIIWLLHLIYFWFFVKNI